MGAVSDGNSDGIKDQPPPQAAMNTATGSLPGRAGVSSWEKGESSKAARGRNNTGGHTWSSVARDGGNKRSDDRTVSEEELRRLKEVFADSLVFPIEEIEDARNEWRGKTLIGKFLSRKFEFDFVAKALLYRWKPRGDVEIIPTTNGFYLFRFACDDDYKKVRSGGPTVVGGTVLALEEWKANFKPNRDVISKATVWLRMPGLPSEYWKRKFVLAIASRAGRPIEVDLCTENMLRGGFARVCVEVDLHCPLVAGTPVGPPEEQIFQEFVYEGIGLYCFRCGVIGHGIHECKCDPNGVRKTIAKVVDRAGSIMGSGQSVPTPTPNMEEKTQTCEATDVDASKGVTVEDVEVGELYGPWLTVPTHRRRKGTSSVSTSVNTGARYSSVVQGVKSGTAANHGGKAIVMEDSVVGEDSQLHAVHAVHAVHAEKGMAKNPHIATSIFGKSMITKGSGYGPGGYSGHINDGPEVGQVGARGKKIEKIKLVGSENSVVKPISIFNWASTFEASPNTSESGDMVVFASEKISSSSQSKQSEKTMRLQNKSGKVRFPKPLGNKFAALREVADGDDLVMAENEGPHIELANGRDSSMKRRRSGEPLTLQCVSVISGPDELGSNGDDKGKKENINVNMNEVEMVHGSGQVAGGTSTPSTQ